MPVLTVNNKIKISDLAKVRLGGYSAREHIFSNYDISVSEYDLIVKKLVLNQLCDTHEDIMLHSEKNLSLVFIYFDTIEKMVGNVAFIYENIEKYNAALNLVKGSIT